MGQARGVVADKLLGLVDGSDGLHLAGFGARLKAARRRPQDFLSRPAVLPLPLLGLAACGGGAASAPPPAPAPAVVAPTITPVAPPAVAPGATSATGNVLPTANQSGASAATISAVSIAGGVTGTVGQALATPLGDFTLRSDGSYSFVVANNDTVKALPNGVSQDITINFTAGNSGGSSSSSIKFTVTGINDAPVATADSITAPAVVTAPITGNVLGNDSDIDRGTTLSVTAITAQAAQIGQAQGGNAVMSAVGTFGSISINTDGSYSYTLDKADADFIALREGQTATEKFEYTVSDGAGGAAKAVLNFTLTGVNEVIALGSVGPNSQILNSAAIVVYNLPSTIITDATPASPYTLIATDLTGGPLPDWIQFNPVSHTFYFVPVQATVRTIDIRLTATESIGSQYETVTTTFRATIADAVVLTAADIIGTSGADSLTGTALRENLSGLAGNDSFVSIGAGDAVDGGDGIDLVDFTGTSGLLSADLNFGKGFLVDSSGARLDFTLVNIENLIAGDGVANFTGNALSNFLTGGSAGDYLFGKGGDDILDGGTGDDALEGGTGADVLRGGDGLDRLEYRASASGVTVNLATGVASGGDAQGDVFSSIESVFGSDFADTLTGDAQSNNLWGFAGDDIIHGLDGQDQLIGDAGNDTIYGDAGFDQIYGGAGDDYLLGGDGGDILNGDAGADRLEGGADQDWIAYTNSPSGVKIDLKLGTLSGGDADGDAIIGGIEGVIGSNYADRLIASDSGSYLSGGFGGDTLIGGAGNDILQDLGIQTGRFDEGEDDFSGNGGDDSISTGPGNDKLSGGDGNDQLNGGPGADLIDGGNGIDTLSFGPELFPSLEATIGVYVDLRSGIGRFGTAAGDMISNVENLTGWDGNDVLIGSAAVNILRGFDGQIEGSDILVAVGRGDTLIAGGGNDLLIDGDIISAGTGNDKIILFEGNQSQVNLTFNGGALDADVIILDKARPTATLGFSFSTSVQNFQSAYDRIDVTDLRDADGSILDINDILSHSSIVGSNTVIDLAGFRIGDEAVAGSITLQGVTSALTSTQFIFSGGPDWQAMLPPDLAL